MRGGDGPRRFSSVRCGTGPASKFLRFIDPYGNTIFNRFEAWLFREDLPRYAEKLTRPSDKESIECIAGLARAMC